MTSQTVRKVATDWLDSWASKLPGRLEALGHQLAFKLSGVKPVNGLLFITLTEDSERLEILERLAKIRLVPPSQEQVRVALEQHRGEFPNGRLLVLRTNGRVSSAWFKSETELNFFSDWFTDQHQRGDIVIAISAKIPPSA